MKTYELNPKELELRVHQKPAEKSFLLSVSLPKPVVCEIDNLSAQDAHKYLEQRKLFDKTLKRSQVDLQKLASA